MKVIISVVSFNTKDLLRDFLESIFKRKWRNNVEVWVVDNASSDGSVQMIKENFPEVHILENKKNIGFGAAQNIVLKKLNANYFLVINSDTLVENRVIDEMVDFMEENPQYGISSCKTLGFNGELQPNAGDLPLGIALINWLFNLEALGAKRSSFHRNEKSYYEDIHEVGWVSGNFMMIKKGVFEKIGYFDEEFFMYFEDTDFCFRAKRSGFKIMLNPEVSIKHLSGGSSNNPRFVQWRGEYIGLIKFYQKHYGVFTALIVKMLSYVSIIFRIIAFALSGKLKHSLIYGKIIFDF